MENRGLDFPLLINSPKKLPITVEQFDNLSCIGLASLMCSYKIIIADRGDKLTLNCADWKGNYFHDMPRFAEVIPGKIYSSVEMAEFDIPKTTRLAATIEKYFKHLYLKNE